jgi:hypothetical protein
MLVRAGFRSLDVASYPLPVQRPTTWEEILLTHLRGDHTSGLVDRPAPVPAVLFGRGEDTFMQKAMMGDHLDGRPLYVLDFGEAHAPPPFERVLDLLGDGSICIQASSERRAAAAHCWATTTTMLARGRARRALAGPARSSARLKPGLSNLEPWK